MAFRLEFPCFTTDFPYYPPINSATHRDSERNRECFMARAYDVQRETIITSPTHPCLDLPCFTTDLL